MFEVEAFRIVDWHPHEPAGIESHIVYRGSSRRMAAELFGQWSALEGWSVLFYRVPLEVAS